MATDTRVELVVFDCNLRGGALEEFEPEVEPEAERGGLWLRVPSPKAAAVQQWERRVIPHRARVWPLAAPVLFAATIVGAAVPWLGLRAGGRPAPPPPPRTVASAEITRVDPARVAPAAAEPASKAVPAVLAAPAAPVVAPKDPAFEQTLAMVSRAYRALDATAVAALLLDTDAAALTQAFSELKYQTLSFDHCVLRPNGAESAVASCDVSLAMAPKSGDGALQRRHEAWTLVLNRSDEAWRIAAVTRR